MRLRGLTGAHDEFVLAAIAQNQDARKSNLPLAAEPRLIVSGVSVKLRKDPIAPHWSDV